CRSFSVRNTRTKKSAPLFFYCDEKLSRISNRSKVSEYFKLEIFSIQINSPQIEASVCQQCKSEKTDKENRRLKRIGNQNKSEKCQHQCQNQGNPPSVIVKSPQSK